MHLIFLLGPPSHHCLPPSPPQCARLAADEYIRLFPERAHAEEFQKLQGQLERGFKAREKQREQWLSQRLQSRRLREVGGGSVQGRSSRV